MDAALDAVYHSLVRAEKWFSYYPGYQGISRVDDDWPDTGSSIIVMYGLFPWCSISLRQTVVSNEPGTYLEIREEALGGTWIDQPSFEFRRSGSRPKILVTIRPSSRFLPLDPMINVIGWLFGFVTDRALQRLRTQLENDAISSGEGGTATSGGV